MGFFYIVVHLIFFSFYVPVYVTYSGIHSKFRFGKTIYKISLIMAIQRRGSGKHCHVSSLPGVTEEYICKKKAFVFFFIVM